MAMSAEEEGKQSKQAEQEGDHRTGISLDQPRQINHLAPDGVLANDRVRIGPRVDVSPQDDGSPTKGRLETIKCMAASSEQITDSSGTVPWHPAGQLV